MRIPTIHLNGTSADALIDQLSEAIDALAVALRRLQDASPNARDYYPQGPHAFTEAQAEHEARWRAIDAVRRELDDIRERAAGIC